MKLALLGRLTLSSKCQPFDPDFRSGFRTDLEPWALQNRSQSARIHSNSFQSYYPAEVYFRRPADLIPFAVCTGPLPKMAKFDEQKIQINFDWSLQLLDLKTDRPYSLNSTHKPCRPSVPSTKSNQTLAPFEWPSPTLIGIRIKIWSEFWNESASIRPNRREIALEVPADRTESFDQKELKFGYLC